MISSIVYFDEIVENVKDATGIENMRPLYDKLKRFVFLTEMEIGGGGLVVRKKKEYTKGNADYDGKVVMLPNDFVGEFTYGSLSQGNIVGRRLELYCDGPSQLDLRYMGFLLDSYGNPFTTRIHLKAIVAYSVYRLYSSRVFLKQGNVNLYQMYKQEYEDTVMEVRGEDAFPTEEQWIEIGRTMNGGAFEAMTNCGMRGFPTGCNDPMYVDADVSEEICHWVAQISGSSNGKATVIGETVLNIKGILEGSTNGVANITGALTEFQSGEVALIGSADGSANVTGILKEEVITVLCNESFNHSGGIGTYMFKLELGAGIGMAGIHYNPASIPDRFRIHWNGQEVANSKFVGTNSSTYYNKLIALGYTPEEINLAGPNTGDLLFFKNASAPSYVEVYVDAPLTSTYWAINGICPYTAINAVATVTGILEDQP